MIKRKRKPIDKEGILKRNAFFLSIWSKKRHYCEICNRWLGNELLSYMVDHLIEKSKRKDLEFEEDNTCLCCFECHECKTNGFPKEKHQELINRAKIKFNI